MLSERHKHIVKEVKEKRKPNGYAAYKKKELERKKKGKLKALRLNRRRVKTRTPREKVKNIKIETQWGCSRLYVDKFKIHRIEILKRQGIINYQIRFITKKPDTYTRVRFYSNQFKMVKQKQRWIITYSYDQKCFLVSSDLEKFIKRYKHIWAKIKPWIELGLI